MASTTTPRNRKIALIAAALVVLVAAGAVLLGPQPDKGSTTSAEALAVSAATTEMVEDPVHGRPFEVSVWQPTAEANRNELVVISHGFSGDRTSHTHLAQGLAAQGYTVAAPTHPDIAGLESGNPTLDPFVLRPRHLSLTIDAMTTASDAPIDSVTVVGHSLGGYSALRLAGADPAVGSEFADHCNQVDDGLLCSGRIETRINAVAVGATMTDARVDRIVLLAPGYGPLFQEAQLNLDVSVMVVAASSDAELPGGQVDSLVDRLPENTTSKSVQGGHYVFLRACTDEEAATVPEICDDPEGTDRVSLNAELVTSISEFAEVA